MNIFFASCLIAGSFFILFFVIHVVKFRLAQPKEKLVFLNRVFMFLLPTCFIATYFISKRFVIYEGSSQSGLLQAATFFLIFWFFCLAFYGLIDHAVRIRIAIELYIEPLTREKLLSKYNPGEAVGARLEKMRQGGYLNLNQGVYSLTPKGLIFAKIAKHGKAFYKSGLGG